MRVPTSIFGNGEHYHHDFNYYYEYYYSESEIKKICGVVEVRMQRVLINIIYHINILVMARIIIIMAGIIIIILIIITNIITLSGRLKSYVA